MCPTHGAFTPSTNGPARSLGSAGARGHPDDAAASKSVAGQFHASHRRQAFNRLVRLGGSVLLRPRWEAPVAARPRRDAVGVNHQSELRMEHCQLAGHLQEPGDSPGRSSQGFFHRGVRRRRRVKTSGAPSRDEIPVLGDAVHLRRAARARSSITLAPTFARGYDPRPARSCGVWASIRSIRRRRRSPGDGSDLHHERRWQLIIQPIYAIRPGGSRATSRRVTMKPRANSCRGANYAAARPWQHRSRIAVFVRVHSTRESSPRIESTRASACIRSG